MSASQRRQRILMVGVGGQGVLTAGNALGDAALAAGVSVMVGQLHGMSQRGGAVECTLMLGSGRTAFVAEGDANLVVAFEPLEALRALPRTAPGATVVVSRVPIVPLSVSTMGVSYPSFESVERDLRKVASEVHTLDPAASALEAGDPRTVNTVMLGAVAGLGLLPVDEATLLGAIEARLPPRLVDVNRRAFQLGVRATAAGDREASARITNG